MPVKPELATTAGARTLIWPQLCSDPCGTPEMLTVQLFITTCQSAWSIPKNPTSSSPIFLLHEFPLITKWQSRTLIWPQLLVLGPWSGHDCAATPMGHLRCWQFSCLSPLVSAWSSANSQKSHPSSYFMNFHCGSPLPSGRVGPWSGHNCWC